MVRESAGSERTRPPLRIFCAATPARVSVAISAAIVVIAATGASPPFWRGGSLTLSEAAALHDQGELVRMIAAGSDPNAVYPLRPGVLAVRSLTPLEAAVGARRAEMVDLLVLHGATVDAPTWLRLHCFAIGTGAADVVATLDRHKPADATASCEGISTPF
jgi:hypothetical protein